MGNVNGVLIHLHSSTVCTAENLARHAPTNQTHEGVIVHDLQMPQMQMRMHISEDNQTLENAPPAVHPIGKIRAQSTQVVDDDQHLHNNNNNKNALAIRTAADPQVVYAIARTTGGPDRPHKIVDHQIHRKTIINVDRPLKIHPLKMAMHRVRVEKMKKNQRPWIRMNERKPKIIPTTNQIIMKMSPTIRISKRKRNRKLKRNCLHRLTVTIQITKKVMALTYLHRKKVNRRMKDDSN